jgi:hydrogenase expression/formation protein HypC
MCQATPVQIQRIEGDVGWVRADGQERPVSLVAVADASVGDYVICHAGLALERLDAEEANAILAALSELEAFASADLIPGATR